MGKELIDTVSLMMSDNYKDRFKAEYYQTQIRYERLKRMVDNWDHLDFNPTCPKAIFLTQLDAMRAYVNVLSYRAKEEGIDL